MTVLPSETQVPLKGFVGEILEKLGGMVLEVQQCQDRRGSARIVPARTVEAAEAMFAMPGSRLGTATGIDVRDGIDVLYHWCFEPAGVVVTLKALAARPEMAIDSITPVLPAANWIEREIHDLLGAEFRNHPDMRRLILDDSWPEGLHPLRKDFDQIADRPPLPPKQVPPEVFPDDGKGGSGR